MLRLVMRGFAMITLSLSLVASCSSLHAGLEPNPAPAASTQAAAPSGQDFEEFPAFPMDGPGKDASWTSNVVPVAPFVEHRTSADPLHPDGLVLAGLHGMPLTHVPPKPWFAYAIYQVPLGLHAADLLSLKLTGELEAAGQSYYVALANFDAMHWEWFGPGGASTDFTIDLASLGYGLTGAWGNMYFAVVVPQEMLLHLEAVELEFADGSGGGGPTFWNVWGKAYDDLALGTVLPGAAVTFEDMLTGTVYSTVTGADGGWGANLPDGFYKFNVTGCGWLFDPGAMLNIDNLETNLEVNAGSIIYHGANAAYDGTVAPMPLMTLNVF